MQKVAVVIPVYNSSGYIKACLNSLISQSFRDFCVYLIDDGSTDNSAAICDMFIYECEKALIPCFVIHTTNNGQAAARNIALQITVEEKICFVDSDDSICREFVERLYNLAEKFSAPISMCGMYSQKETSKNNENKPVSSICKKVDERFFLDLFHDDWQERGFQNDVVWAKLISKDILLQIPLDEGHTSEDTATVCRWFDAAGIVAETDEKLYFYTDNPFGTENTQNKKKSYDKILSLKKRLDFYNEKGYKRISDEAFHNYCYMIDKISDINKELEAELKREKKKAVIKNLATGSMPIKKRLIYMKEFLFNGKR